MSIVACVKVYDGIVLGAESMSQLWGQSTPGQPQFVKAYSNAKKLFNIGSYPFGVVSYGAGNIGTRSIESFMYEFNETLSSDPLPTPTGEAIATRLINFMRSPYDTAFGQLPIDQRPVLGFYLAGYSPSRHVGTEWEFVFPKDAQPHQPRLDDQFGSSWRGVSVPFYRLFFGIDPRLIEALRTQGIPDDVLNVIQQTANQFVSRIAFDGMPIQDAIGFCKFILETTIGQSTYEVGVPSCGGPLHIAVITRRDGFDWITQPKYIA